MSLIQSVEAEGTLGLEYIVQRLEASRTRPRLADVDSKPQKGQLHAGRGGARL